MVMEGFRNVVVGASREMLCAEEISVILAALNKVLALFGEKRRPNKGTIMLYGQRKGTNGQYILQMNLESVDSQDLDCIGGYYEKTFSDGQKETSDVLAERSIEAILSWPKVPAYGYEAQNECFGEMPSGFYQDEMKRVLVLNTTFGRFVISAWLAIEITDGWTDDARMVELPEESILIMRALASILFKMAAEKDVVLGYSLRCIAEELGFLEVMAERYDELDDFYANGAVEDDEAEYEGRISKSERVDMKREGLAILFDEFMNKGLSPQQVEKKMKQMEGIDNLKVILKEYGKEVTTKMWDAIESFTDLILVRSGRRGLPKGLGDDKEWQQAINKLMKNRYSAEWMIVNEIRNIWQCYGLPELSRLDAMCRKRKRPDLFFQWVK